MLKPFLIDHLDLRVRDWRRAVDFYDIALAPLGVTRESPDPQE